MTEEQWKKYATETFMGFDTDEIMCRLSCMNLMFHSVTNPQLNKQDSVLKDYMVKDTYDLIFTKTNAGGTEKVWFYDMKAEGHSLDDKRQPIEENDIPDIIERFHHKENEETRERNERIARNARKIRKKGPHKLFFV